MKILRLLCLGLLMPFCLFAQHEGLSIRRVAQAPPEFLELLITNDSISANDALNEHILDLVEVSERDTLVPTRFRTHQTYLFNWFVHAIGYWWEAVDMKRYKFVGTNKDSLKLRPTDEDFLTEHDINFNLLPHTQKYTELMMRGNYTQLSKYKAWDKDMNKPPFIWPTDSTLMQYRVHCELTPPRKLRDSLNVLFYPCLPGPNLDRHPNFCDLHPSVGMYGPFVLDCNHSCHPEIHPYEWLWWMDLAEEPKNGDKSAKTWMTGFMRESSNRFWRWSRNPRVGTISIPFIFSTKKDARIRVEHLVMGKAAPRGAKKMHGVPEETAAFTEESSSITLEWLRDFHLSVNSNRAMDEKAFRWWLSELSTDEKNEYVWGRFNILASIKDGWTARIVME